MKRLVLYWAASLLMVTAVAQEAGDVPEDQQDLVVPQVAISAFLVKMSPQLAADWGLDGGPAAKPETSPLKGDIPKCMTKEQARTVITALRGNKETEILGSLSIVVQSGQEAFGGNVREMMVPESFDEPDIYLDDEPVGEDGEKKTVATRGGRKVDPNVPPTKFNLADLVPIFGAPRTDVGFVLTVIPQVGADGKTISLSLHPKLTVDKLVDEPLLPMFTTIEMRSEISLRDGQTLILMNGTPGLNGDYFKYKDDAATDRRPFILFVTTDLVTLPKSKK